MGWGRGKRTTSWQQMQDRWPLGSMNATLSTKVCSLLIRKTEWNWLLQWQVNLCSHITTIKSKAILTQLLSSKITNFGYLSIITLRLPWSPSMNYFWMSPLLNLFCLSKEIMNFPFQEGFSKCKNVLMVSTTSIILAIKGNMGLQEPTMQFWVIDSLTLKKSKQEPLRKWW